MFSRFVIAVLIVCPGALPVDCSSDIHKQGKIEVPDYCSVNLDRGQCSCTVTLDGDGSEPRHHPGGKGWDFWYQTDGKASYLHPQNGGRLAVGGPSGAGFSGCTAADFSKRRIRVDQLPAGTHVCLRNKAGRVAEIELDGVNPKNRRLQIAYVTWEK